MEEKQKLNADHLNQERQKESRNRDNSNRMGTGSGKENRSRLTPEEIERRKARRAAMTPEELERRKEAQRRRAAREAHQRAGNKSRAQKSSRNGRGRQAKRRRRKRNLILRMILLFIVIVMALAGALLWKKYSPSKEQADKNEYYGIEHEGQMAIILDNERLESYGIISDGKAYVQYDTVHDYLNDRFYLDHHDNQLLYTLPNGTVCVEVGSKDYSISNEKQSEDYVILKTEGNTAYVALEFVQKYSNIDFSVYEDPNRAVITSKWGEVKTVTVKRDTQVRFRGGVKSPILTEVEKKSELVVLDNEENWKKVCTKDGYIGYIKKSALKKEKVKTLSREFEEPEYTNISKDYTINMVWHNVTNEAANTSGFDKIVKAKGINTIAPTWYHVKNTNGDIQSISSIDYVDFAHKTNIEVWATIRDFDGGISSNDESLELLSKTSHRENLINQLIADAVRTKIDGINVDFEKISAECGEHYIQFIRELSVKCRQNNLVLSVDNYVPKGYNTQYHRKEQGIVADYVVIMGYDEHFGGSKEAGPVASYNFVKDGIEETMKEVPAGKIINGMPFFSRVWKEVPKSEKQIASEKGTEDEQYPTIVESQALGMSAAQAKVSQAGAKITWDDEAKQNFATWKEKDATYKIWLEDGKSMEPRLQLMKDNQLAGCAEWALGQESDSIWSLIHKYVN